MSITTCLNKNGGRLFTLHSEKSSYQMLADEKGTLIHLYYGKKIEEQDDLTDLLYLTDMGFSGNPSCAGSDRTYSLDTLPLEMSSFGLGDYRNSMLVMQNADGSRAGEFKYDSYEIVEGSYVVDGMPALYDTEDVKAQTLIITLKETINDLKLELFYSVFEDKNIITRAAKLTNHSGQSVVLERFLSMNMDMMFMNPDMIYFAGRHAMERTLERVPVAHGKVEIGSTRGTSSHHYNPAMILCDKTATEDQGNCYGFCLVYSGNFVGAAQKDSKDQVRVQMGINGEGFRFTVKSGESFMTPQVVMSYSADGLGTLSRQYHDIIRENLCRGRYKFEKRPVLINNWEATYFDFNKDRLIAIAKQASELGIEMLVLDDGWFGKRDDDNSGLGDWFTNEKKLGGTLKELGDEINAMNMKFGLWFEPEMVSEDSDLFRAHPDWALRIPGRDPIRGRNQLVLDMSRTDVREYLFDRLKDILSNAPIAYVKWDMNRSICDVYSHFLGEENSGELYHRYVLGLYDLLERFHNQFPDVLLEGCSGGGGRFDAAMLYYSPQFWCSDNTDAVNRLSIQYGTSFFYPVSAMGAHVSACPNHQTGRSVSFATRGDVALAGSFGYELDLNKVTDEEKQLVKKQLEKFHKFYDLTHAGDYYRLTDLKAESCMAWAFVSKKKDTAMVTVVKTEVEGNPIPTHVCMKGLDEKKQYQCTINDQTVTKSGAAWMYGGITVPFTMTQYESLIIEFKEV